MSGVESLSISLFEAYSRNSGNPPDAHFNRAAAEQWMAQALIECGVAELIEAGRQYQREVENPAPDYLLRNRRRNELFAALARVTGGAA